MVSQQFLQMTFNCIVDIIDTGEMIMQLKKIET